MSNNSPRELATELRNSGYSYNMISNRLGIAKSTLSNWFKDRPFTANIEVLKRIQYGPIKSGQLRHNRKVEEINKFKDLGMLELGGLSKRDLWLLGLGLYIGEGSKSHETIRIINSDPEVIRLAIRWFKECCNLNDENITIAIHLYPDNHIGESLQFWRKVTGLTLKNFRKTQIDQRKDKLKIKKTKLPYGTAHLMIISNGNPKNGVQLYRRINGWISQALLNN